MNEKKLFFVGILFLFFYYLLNYLTPLSFGDDYLYSFIWEGHSLYEPLSENAVRISTWNDLFVSQIHHYFTWSGRIVNHTLAQLFLWASKSVFNICNAFVSILLVAEIYWCSHKGVVTAKMNVGMLIGIFFALWAFTPEFGAVFLWLVGACNYLWTVAFLIGFLVPYIRKYYLFSEKIHESRRFCLFMFFLGIAAGCTNENTVCWIILILAVSVFKFKGNEGFENWLYTGLGGLFLGYALLMLSPGNIARFLVETKGDVWLTWTKIAQNAALLFLILLYFNILLWLFNLHSFYYLHGLENKNMSLAKDVFLAKIMCVGSFCMTFMMLFSPNFPPRSAFPGTVLLIIAASILWRVQEEYSITIVKEGTKKLLYIVGTMFFVITAVATFYGLHYYREQIEDILASVKTSDYAKSNVIVVNSLRPMHDVVRKSSYFHLISYKMSSNENDWRNVAFARYYGIKGIRMLQKQTETKE